MATNEEMLGRSDVNDLEAILSVTTSEVDELIHAVKDNADALFTWNYEKGERPALNKLYEKAKNAQWNAEPDRPWATVVDIDQVVGNAPWDGLTDPVYVAGSQPRQADGSRYSKGGNESGERHLRKGVGGTWRY